MDECIVGQVNIGNCIDLVVVQWALCVAAGRALLAAATKRPAPLGSGMAVGNSTG